MFTRCHESAYGREAFEVVTLSRYQRPSFEVCDDLLEDVLEALVSHFSVWSLRSGRMLPHPKLGLKRVQHLGPISGSD